MAENKWDFTEGEISPPEISGVRSYKLYTPEI